MITQNIIEQDGKPVAVILDYAEYISLVERAQDREDYTEAVQAKQAPTNWTDHATVKAEVERMILGEEA